MDAGTGDEAGKAEGKPRTAAIAHARAQVAEAAKLGSSKEARRAQAEALTLLQSLEALADEQQGSETKAEWRGPIGPEEITVRPWHNGLLWPVSLAVATAALVGLGVWMRGRGAKMADMSPVPYVVALLGLVFGLVFGQHTRCPRCKGWWARTVVSKTYSHASTTTDTVHTPDGGHRTSTSQRGVYDAKLLCRRCGLRWNARI